MLKYLIENSDLKAILKFGPQNFFKAVDWSKTWDVVQQIRRNSKDDGSWEKTHRGFQSLLQDSESRIRWPSSSEFSKRISRVPVIVNELQGQWILHLFFYQIFYSDSWILDFRKEAWSFDSQDWLNWAPQKLYFSPSPEFKKGVQNLYLGFYLNQADLFEEGLKSLGVHPAREILREHFGQGDQTEVMFQLKHLEVTFGQVFAACARSQVLVHPEFSAFGVMLLSLYETFETAHLKLNVRQIFEEVI